MKIRFKEKFSSEFVDDEGMIQDPINWYEGDTEDCIVSDRYISGVKLEFPDGLFVENVPNRVFDIIEN